MVRIKRYVYSFSFTRIFSHRVFPSKVLTRHIIYGHPRGSVINLLNEWIVHKVGTWTTIHIHKIHEPFWIRMYLFIMILNMVTFGVISHSINRVVHSLLYDIHMRLTYTWIRRNFLFFYLLLSYSSLYDYILMSLIL